MKTSNNHIGNRSASTNCATAYPTRLCIVLTEQCSMYYWVLHTKEKRIQIVKYH